MFVFFFCNLQNNINNLFNYEKLFSYWVSKPQQLRILDVIFFTGTKRPPLFFSLLWNIKHCAWCHLLPIASRKIYFFPWDGSNSQKLFVLFWLCRFISCEIPKAFPRLLYSDSYNLYSNHNLVLFRFVVPMRLKNYDWLLRRWIA